MISRIRLFSIVGIIVFFGFSTLWQIPKADSAVSGQVAAYGFDEGSGQTTLDTSGNSNTGTLFGTVWGAGKYSNGLVFNGSSSYVDLSKADLFDALSTGTIEVWVKQNTTTGYQTWFGADSANCAHPFELSMNGGNFSVWAGASGCAATFNATVPVTNPTSWHHLAYVVTSTGNQFYVDGVLKTATYIKGTATSRFFFSSAATGITHYNIGRTAFDSTETFNGTIDELRIYNRALSAAEIQSDMNTPVNNGLPLPTASLTASPTTITQGQSSILSWSTTNAATVSINQGIGIVTASSSISVTPATTTTYTLTATNTTGTVTSQSTITVNIPDTSPPTVSMLTPPDGTTVTGNVTVSATASDNIGVVGVQFKLDGANLGLEDTTSPYSVTWNTNTATNTTHTLTALARDAAGNTAISTTTSVGVNNPPMMIITLPAQNATINGSVLNISYTEMGDMTGVDGARFQIDGGPVMQDPTFDGSFSVANISPGSHILTGFLTQLEMMIAGSDATPVNFTMVVPDMTPPTVSVTAPAASSTVSASVTINAAASDNVGVAGVQFQIDGTNFGTQDTTSPYSITWDTTLFSNGQHTIVAVARDASLNIATSTAINVTVSNLTGAAVVGQWSAPVATPTVLVHGIMLSTGKVLAWSTGNQAELLDVSTNTFNPVPDNITDLLCAGQVVLTSGKPMVIGGGGISPGAASNHGDIFNTATSLWSSASSMVKARWYPTETVLSDGRILSTSGANGGTTSYVPTPEIYNPKTNAWTLMTSSATNSNTPNYPFMYVLPDGRVAFAGASEYDTITQILDVNSQTWSTVDSNILPGSSGVMYAPGKVMKSGSAADSGFSGPAGKTTYVIDFNQTNPAWHRAGDMANPRSFMNLTALPDGNVLVTGGETTKDGANVANAVKAAELWNPATETWTTMASEARPRLYHSIALLLPDGRVFVSGGGNDAGVPDELTAEYYSPGYLFRGARPAITSAPPATVQYGSQFFVGTPDASSIVSVSLIKAGAVTHFTNMEQRFMNLAFTQTPGGITVNAPANSNLATPGVYMLFILNSNGVPSIAPFVTLPSSFDDSQPPTAPSNLNATGGIGAANLSWTLSTDNVGVTAYNIYRSTVSGFIPSSANKIGQTASTSYTDIVSAGTYYYRITAQDSAGNISPASNESSGTVTNDTVAPTISMTTPANGSTVSGTSVTVSANASDNVGVAGVQFKLDGANLGAEVTTSPYSSIWNTASATNGPHTLSAVARDGAGNMATSTAVSVTVSNTSVPIALVQKVSNTTTGGSSLAASFTSAVTAGNFIVVGVSGWPMSGTLAVTDSLGNIYTRAGTVPLTPGNSFTAIFYAKGIKGGIDTVTFGNGVSGTQLSMTATEFSGIDTVSPLDAVSDASGSSNAPSSGTMTPTMTGDLVIGAGTHDATIVTTAGSGFTMIAVATEDGNTHQSLASEYKIGSLPIAATFLLTSSTAWAQAGAMFKPATQ